MAASNKPLYSYTSEMANRERSINIRIHLYKILLATTEMKMTGNSEVISDRFNAHRFCRQVASSPLKIQKQYKNM
jgi:hypothetical protein